MPFARRLARAYTADRHCREAGADDRQRDARIAPEQLLPGDRDAEAAGLKPLLGEEIERVQADLRRLLQDRPRRLLALVPLRGGGPDHVPGEPVHPVAHLAHARIQVEREAAVVRFCTNAHAPMLLHGNAIRHGDSWRAAVAPARDLGQLTRGTRGLLARRAA